MQNVEFVRTGYGKNAVRVMVIKRQGSHHYLIELKANVEITLKSRKDYLTGDNSDIIPTDTIKNTVHALAKIKGVSYSFTVLLNTFQDINSQIFKIASKLHFCYVKNDIFLTLAWFLRGCSL